MGAVTGTVGLMSTQTQRARPAKSTTSPETRQVRPSRYDHAERRKATRARRQKGCYVYLPAEELARAGFSPDDPPPFYKTDGYQRGPNGHTVIVSLYRDR